MAATAKRHRTSSTPYWRPTNRQNDHFKLLYILHDIGTRPDLRGPIGSEPQASLQQSVSHQTVHLFISRSYLVFYEKTYVVVSCDTLEP